MEVDSLQKVLEGEWLDFEWVWISLAGMDLGRYAYGSVSIRYDAPNRFQGDLQRVIFHLGSGFKINHRDDY